MQNNSVVVLESNVAILEQLKNALEESKDFTLLHAGDDGDEGMKEILRLKPDLVIVSMFLKGTDGCGVMRVVKKTWPTAKIIATGLANDEIIEKALTEGASYYLSKPFSMSTAMERITELLQSKPVVNNNSVAIDINDEDMMAAILVATIDYRNEVKEDVKVINVREVK